MAMIKCNKGHIYDSAQGRCPICAMGTGAFVVDDIPATSPVQPWPGAQPGMQPGMRPGMQQGMPGMQPGMRPGMQHDVGVTMPGEGFGFASIGETEPVTNPGFTAGDFSTNSKPGSFAPMVDDYDATEPEPINGMAGFDPVVGWLICVKGPSCGKDYRLHGGTNFIGRSKEMDVCIEDDQTISKHNAASISYDDRSRTFFIQKGEVRNLLYLNGKPVRSDADLVAYDRIEIGHTELMFLPLCGENFSWQDI